MKILADASLPLLEKAFPPPFELSTYKSQDEIYAHLPHHTILLCRSTLAVTKTLLSSHQLDYVATASSGIDHIDHVFLKKQGITLLDAKGSNAPAVADYVLATIAYLQKNFSFREKKVGVIGVGAVGTLVSNRLKDLGFDILSYDPPKSMIDNNFISVSLKEILNCNLICLHANLHDEPPYPSRNLLVNELNFLKPDCALINASRGGIVSETALLNIKKPLFYCTDVFLNEPALNEKIVQFATLCTPHIAGHSVEAKNAAVCTLSKKLHACYGLPPPTFLDTICSAKQTIPLSTNWADYILSLYNPANETKTLKEARDKKEAFLRLRKAHQFRHDFNNVNLSDC